jgi:hypothetical protein
MIKMWSKKKQMQLPGSFYLRQMALPKRLTGPHLHLPFQHNSSALARDCGSFLVTMAQLIKQFDSLALSGRLLRYGQRTVANAF